MEEKSPQFISECARRAAVLEASAEKPGNVTPTKGFDDLSYQDFVEAAVRLKPFMARAARAGGDAEIGKLIYDATSGEKNVNFGIIIMFMPLAAARGGNTKGLLESLKKEDSKWIVKAMQKGRLGGMGLRDKSLSRYDVYSKGIFGVIGEENITPLKLMEIAQPYDTLAREWVGDYPIARAIGDKIEPREGSIIKEYLRILSEHPDTLIARKRGLEEARIVSKMAKDVLDGIRIVGELDAYLRTSLPPAKEQGKLCASCTSPKADATSRADGNALNPGTTADLIASGLFIRLMLNRASR